MLQTLTRQQLLVILLGTLWSTAYSLIFVEDKTCRTPDHKIGECINLKQCKPLMTVVLKEEKTGADIQLLQRSQCGFEGDTPKVCCVNHPFEPHYKPPSSMHTIYNPTRNPPVYNNPKPVYQPYNPYGNQGTRKPDPSSLIFGDQIFFGSSPLPIPNTLNVPESSNGHTNKQPNHQVKPTHTTHPKPTKPKPPSLSTNHGTNGDSTVLPDVSHHRNLGLINKNNCGNVLNDRIVNGNRTKLLEFPWMALLAYSTKYGTEYLCGGTVINHKYILTAAHCVQGLDSDQSLLGVRLGEHDTSKEKDCERVNSKREFCAPPTQDYLLEEVIAHPGFELSQKHDDIALIRIKGRANFDQENVLPVCLPTGENRYFDGKKGIVTGWGVTEDGLESDVLLRVDLPMVPNHICSQSYVHSVKIIAKQMCAGGQDGKDSCSGDSGGPLVYIGTVNADTKYIQHGIVSFGPVPCALQGKPGVYTRVASYMDWILDHMRP